MPNDGNVGDAKLAWFTHTLLLQWRQNGCQQSGSAIAASVACSSSTWSRTALGERWIGDVLLTGLVLALRSPRFVS